MRRIFAALFLAACGGSDNSDTDGATDVTTTDVASDAPKQGICSPACKMGDFCYGTPGSAYVFGKSDGGVLIEGGVFDAGMFDGGGFDAQPPDAGSNDAGVEGGADASFEGGSDGGPTDAAMESGPADDSGPLVDAGSMKYGCNKMPSACATTPTCDCLKNAYATLCKGMPPHCLTDGTGELVIACPP